MPASCRLPLGVLALAAFLWPATSTCAQTCREGPSITVRFVGDGWDPNLSASVMTELVAATRLQGFAVCADDGGSDTGASDTGAAVAHVELSADQARRVRVAVEVHDEVTNKRLRRDVDLSVFSDDSRALALAVAVDELLRASWMELALSRDQPPRTDTPPAVADVVERELAAITPRRTELGVVAHALWHSGGVLLMGAELYASHMFIDEIGAELSLGAALGLAESSRNGTTTARSFGGELALLVRVFRLDIFSLVLRGALRVVNVEFEGTAIAPAAGRSLSGIAVTPGLGVVGALVFERVNVRLGVDVGGVVRGVAALDDDALTYAVEGIAIGAHLGIGVRL